MWITLGVIFAITTVLGFAWKWHAWVICWAVFYGIAITLFTGFFTNRGGVWSGIWGSLDYTWRPESRHADGPVYYYGMMLPAYEFLPLVAVALGGVALLLIGGWRNRITMIAAGAAIALLTIAPESAPMLDEHRVLLATAIAGTAVLSLRVPDLTKFLAFWAVAALGAFTMIGRKDPWLTVHVALPMIMLSAKLVNDAVVAFELPALTVPQFRVYAPRRLAQGMVAATFAVLSVFTLRTGILAGWGHGSVPQLTSALAQRDHGDTPIELLTAQENAPDVRALAVAIDAAAAESGQGTRDPDRRRCIVRVQRRLGVVPARLHERDDGGHAQAVRCGRRRDRARRQPQPLQRGEPVGACRHLHQHMELPGTVRRPDERRDRITPRQRRGVVRLVQLPE